MTHLRRWGAAYVLAVLWLASMAVYLATEEPGKATAGTFENLQSEWAQLLVQAVLVVGWAKAVFAKSTEDLQRLEAKVDRLLERRPQE